MTNRKETFLSLHRYKISAVLVFVGGILIFLFFLHAKYPLAGRIGSSFIVRVRVIHDAREINISSKVGIFIKNNESGSFGKEVSVIPIDKGVKLNDMAVIQRKIGFFADKGGDLVIAGKDYRGSIDVINTGKGLDAVNNIELDDYLKGVLPREVNSLWPYQAIKAQAIASRSFAISRAFRNRKKDYDLTDDTYSQVYGGRSSEKWRTSRAVDETRGKVLVHNGKILPAYFHSCCGGHTEDIYAVWGIKETPLAGVKCSWCRLSPYFWWGSWLSTVSVMDKLRKGGYEIEVVDEMKAGPRDASGRIGYVSIRSGERRFKIRAADLTALFGKNNIKSTNMRIIKYPFFYHFSGHGWGHGVGMCQWGAFGLALRWWSAEKILRYYYPGAEIADYSPKFALAASEH